MNEAYMAIRVPKLTGPARLRLAAQTLYVSLRNHGAPRRKARKKTITWIATLRLRAMLGLTPRRLS